MTRLTNADKDFIVRAYKAGATQQELAARFNVSHVAIGNVTRAHGLARPDRKRPAFDFASV